MSKIKLLVMDVDGTLTDGKIYMGSSGEAFKAFDIKDGYGIHEILPKAGIVPAIITGRKSDIVLNRCRELEIEELYQGYHDKTLALCHLLKKYNCSKEDIAYIGDDVLDLECMMQCGIKGCPSDAVEQVKEICDFVCNRAGGQGAVREFIEWIIKR